MSKSTTISEFQAIERKEWNHWENNSHEEDSMPFNEWLTEHNQMNQEKYGIKYTGNEPAFEYLPTNTNYTEPRNP